MCEPTLIATIGSAVSSIGSSGALSAISLGSTIIGGVMSANAANQQGRVAQQVAKNNATIAEYQATDAVRRGSEEANAIRRRASQLEGTQRATMAARGLDLTGGTPQQLLDETNFFGEADQRTARYNGSVEAWGKRAQASNMRAEGAAAASAGRTQAFSTLLGTGGTVADKWYRYGSGAPAASPAFTGVGYNPY